MVNAAKAPAVTDGDAREEGRPFAAALLSIGFLMDSMEKILWRTGPGRGPWEACLAALVLAYNPACKPRRLLEALPAERPMDRTGFLNAMANLGYFPSGMGVALKDLEPRLLPCLFIADGNDDAPMVLLSRGTENFTVYDGAAHEIRAMAADDAKETGGAFFFLPYDQHRQQTSKFMREGTGRAWFTALARRFSVTLRRILVACFVLNIFAIIPALFVMAVYDRVISPSDLTALPALVVGVFMAIVAEYVLRGARSEGLAWMTARLDYLVGGRIFAQLIGLAPAVIDRASVAAQVARIRTFESVRDFFSSGVFLSFLEIPFVLIAAAAMWTVAGSLILVPLVMICAYAALFVVMRYKVKTAIRLAAKASSARQQFTIETFEKLRSVRLNGLGGAWDRKFDDLAGREILMNFHLGFLGTVGETLANGLTVLAAVGTICFGAHLVWAGEMTTGALVASMILVWRILLPFYSLCTMIPRLEQLRSSIAQVNSLMELDAEGDTPLSVLPALRGDIAIEGVTMQYEGSPDPLFAGLDFHVPAGGIGAVTGRNGSGKTSLIKLVKDLYVPTQGTVRIDGFDMRQLDPAELRRQIGYVPQKADFFPGTVAENLVVCNLLATREDIEAALRRADAWDDVRALPDGMDTQVADCRFSLSLSTRLSLARAYLQNAQVLVIDELPNVVLNGVAGRNLKEYIADGKGRRTVLIASHRHDFLGMADVIVRLARGETPKAGRGADMMKLIREAA